MDDLTSTVEDGATSQVVLQRESDPTLCLGARTLCSARYGNTTREKLMAAASWSFLPWRLSGDGRLIRSRAGQETAKTSLYKHFGQ